jgi:PAS domain S-box-containing protein
MATPDPPLAPGPTDAVWHALFAGNLAPMAIYRRSDFRLRGCNDAFLALYGYAAQEVQGLTIFDLCVPGEREAVRTRATTLHGSINTGLWQHQRRDGVELQVLVRSTDTHYLGEDCRLLVLTEFHAQDRSRTREHQRQALLQSLAQERPLAGLLQQLALDHEAMFPGTLCAVALLDATGARLLCQAAPSLPAALVAVLDGQPLDGDSGCATAACTSGQRVIVEDIALHARALNWRDAAQAAGAHAVCGATGGFGDRARRGHRRPAAQRAAAARPAQCHSRHRVHEGRAGRLPGLQPGIRALPRAQRGADHRPAHDRNDRRPQRQPQRPE